MTPAKNLTLPQKILIAAGLFGFIFLAVQFWPKKSFNWQEETGYRWAELPPRKTGKPGFTLLSPSKTKITFTNRLSQEQIENNRFLLGGSGVATGDIDGDDLVDVYFACLDGPNVLYKNLGNWKFKDVTEEAGVACPDRFSNGVTFADIDGDNDLDLLVTALGGPNACFLNDGSGNFTEVTESVGLKSNMGSTSMALADIDGDGDLDLYITNFKKKSVENLYPPHERAPNRVTRKIGDTFEVVPKFKEHYRIGTFGGRSVLLENPDPDFLYLNDGNGHFKRVSFTDGRFLDETGKPFSELRDWGLLARLQDFDNDGDPDIYVCNDYWSPDRIWINDGQGHFQAIDKLAIRHTSKFTMAVDFSDIDRDGDLDFLLIDMLAQDHQRRMQQMGTDSQQIPAVIGKFDDRPQIKRNTLFLNRGDNTYAEIGQFSGVHATEWTWSTLFLDVDLDGYEDILLTNGQLHDFEDADTNNRVQSLALFGHDYRKLTSLYPNYLTANIAFRNNGDLTFENVGEQWGFTVPDVAWGMALADFDNDGDLDIATNRLDKPAGIYRNESNAPRVAIRLKGLPVNSQGVGAKIRVLGGPVLQSKEIVCGGTYLSSSDPLAVFAAGSVENNLNIEVTWRNGNISQVKNVIPNRIYEIFEPTVETNQAAIDSAALLSPYFEDVSHLINHIHHEDVYDDFKRQPLLPNRLSQSGPGVAWLDLDGDGDDDLVIASGKGGQLSCFINQGGDFKKSSEPLLNKISLNDQTTVLGFSKSQGAFSLLVGNSNFEDSKIDDSFIMQYDFKNGQVESTRKIQFNTSSIGALALADTDGDGDLDLFAGGRTVPGRYPEAASSLLFKNQNGKFTTDELNRHLLEKIGMVTGAVFCDIDADGDPDLLLSLEWGAVTVLLNENGIFRNATDELGLNKYLGWWNGLTTGDFNEDGKLDIIATNWGLNDKFGLLKIQPMRIYFHDFDNNGIMDIIEAYLDPKSNTWVPGRSLDDLAAPLPLVKKRVPTHKKFASSTLEEIIGPDLELAAHLQANTFAHTLFINKGDHFEAKALPDEAQFAPAFGVGVSDFDGDGHEDVFISQNFFATPKATSRADAGRGLWLKGDGAGNFKSMPGHETGIKVYGEQRGAALGDFDKDGRVDLVVTQNGSATKLYRNTGAKPGLRVRLIGPSGNPLGIGASLRMIYKNGFGPAREIHAGSGYWSQDSAVQVMGLREKPVGISVRWPGGKVTNSDLPRDAREITIDRKGNITVLD